MAMSWSVVWDCRLGCTPIHLRNLPVSGPTRSGPNVSDMTLVVDVDAVRLAVTAHYQGTHQGETP